MIENRTMPDTSEVPAEIAAHIHEVQRAALEEQTAKQRAEREAAENQRQIDLGRWHALFDAAKPHLPEWLWKWAVAEPVSWGRSQPVAHQITFNVPGLAPFDVVLPAMLVDAQYVVEPPVAYRVWQTNGMAQGWAGKDDYEYEAGAAGWTAEVASLNDALLLAQQIETSRRREWAEIQAALALEAEQEANVEQAMREASPPPFAERLAAAVGEDAELQALLLALAQVVRRPWAADGGG